MKNNTFKLWPGNNRFFCKGRIMAGYPLHSPGAHRSILSFLLILISGTLLSIFAIELGYIYMLANLVLLILTLTVLVLLSTKDPGYIPKQIPPFAKGPYGSPIVIHSIQLEPNRQSPFEQKMISVSVNGKNIKLKYCSSCKGYLGYILRPPRSSHCFECNLCVERFDHHCPWVGTCIGVRNYRVFFLLINSFWLYCVYGLVICILHMSFAMYEEDSVGRAIEQNVVAISLFLFVLPFACFSIGLSLFHVYLILGNMTTKEYLKKNQLKENPYSISL